jgi:hypothetical protein
MKEKALTTDGKHVVYYSVFITDLPVAVVTTVQEVAGV